MSFLKFDKWSSEMPFVLLKQDSFFFPQNYVIAPLHVASKYGNLNIVTLLVEKGSKVDIPNKVCFVIYWCDLWFITAKLHSSGSSVTASATTINNNK